MKYVGIALVALAAALVTSSYRSRLLARTSLLETFVALALHIRARVTGYLEPPSVWANGYRAEGDEVGELLLRVRRGETPEAAYLAIRDGLSLSAEAKELVGSFLSGLGRDDVGNERKNMDIGVDKLSALLEKERDECAERGRIAAVMALMLSAGGAILII